MEIIGCSFFHKIMEPLLNIWAAQIFQSLFFNLSRFGAYLPAVFALIIPRLDYCVFFLWKFI